MDDFEIYCRGWSLMISGEDRDLLLEARLIRPTGTEEDGDFTLADKATWAGVADLLNL